MDILDDFIGTIIKPTINTLAKLSVVGDVNLIRVDRSNYSLINCENFTLQLIFQERKANKKTSLHPVSASDAHEPTTLNDQTCNYTIQHIRHMKIGSFFSFDSPDVSDMKSLGAGSFNIHFLTDEETKVVVSDHRGNWELSVAYTPESGIRIQPDMVTTELKHKDDCMILKQLNSDLPCAKSSPELFQNGNKYCALAKIKHEAIINLNANAVRFSKAAFLAVYAVPIYRKRDDNIFLEAKMHIFAIVNGSETK